MKKLLKFIPVGSVALAVTTLLSYSLGLLRDHIFANTFGASRLLDAYNAAFLIPDLLFNILIAGGIAAAFIPVFTELLKSDQKRAQEYANSVTTAAVATMTLVAVLILIFAKQISFSVAPGFDLASRDLVVKILRILALSPIFFGASNAIGAILISKKRFLFYGLSPALYNLGIILGALLLAPHYGVMGVAFGTLGGAVLHLVARVIDIFRSGFNLKPEYNFRAPEFLKTIKLMIPKMFGHPIELATFWGFTVIASTLVPGSVAVLSFSRNFQSVAVSLIGITVATASFPVLAGAITGRSVHVFWQTFRNSFWVITLGSVMSAFLIFIIREPLIKFFLGGGAFGADDIHKTAATLGMFCLSIPSESLVHLVARSFYATKNTVVPVLISIIGIVIAIPSAYLLSTHIGVLALPLGFFIGSATELSILLVLLFWRMRRLIL